MTYRTPPSRQEAVSQTLERLLNAERILLTTHINADGDGAGSQIALAAWYRALGRDAWIVNPTPIPNSLRFMLPDPGWTVDPGSPKAKGLAETADLAVILDTGEIPRIGRVMGLFKDLPAVVIDHHPTGSQPIPGVSFRDPTACATGELVFDLIRYSEGPWPRATALGLYVAILSDTGSFRFSNTSPAAHLIAAALLGMGVDPEDAHRRVYGNLPFRKLQLLKAALAELELDEEGRVAWMTVPTQAYEDLGAVPDDLEGFVDYPRGMEGVEVGLLFRETVRGASKVSFRSNGDVDVNALARRYGGGGHVRASGAVVERPLREVRPEIVDAVRRAVREERKNDGD